MNFIATLSLYEHTEIDPAAGQSLKVHVLTTIFDLPRFITPYPRILLCGGCHQSDYAIETDYFSSVLYRNDDLIRFASSRLNLQSWLYYCHITTGLVILDTLSPYGH